MGESLRAMRGGSTPNTLNFWSYLQLVLFLLSLPSHLRWPGHAAPSSLACPSWRGFCRRGKQPLNPKGPVETRTAAHIQAPVLSRSGRTWPWVEVPRWGMSDIGKKVKRAVGVS